MERVINNLNQAMHRLFQSDPSVFLIGEDIADPYGGAFKAAKGLSSAYSDRVISSPISELAIAGFASGLSLMGNKPIVEVMFGDFAALCFDQILNFISKSVTMYGRHYPLNFLLRCPVGGNRGYGPTHSQSLQKHFIGIPNLNLFELSPFHDSYHVLSQILNSGIPSILFEDKVLYTEPMFTERQKDEDLFQVEFLDQAENYVRVFSEYITHPSIAVITGGGTSYRCLAAMNRLFMDYEIGCEMFVTSKLYPLDLQSLLPFLHSKKFIFVVEESTAGGTWGNDISVQLYQRMMGTLSHPIQYVHSKDSVIPSTRHLETAILVQEEDVYQAIRTAVAS
jgi:pyruvate/2-oxoglutarate/acetoin dehydrogenase E1 component